MYQTSSTTLGPEKSQAIISNNHSEDVSGHATKKIGPRRLSESPKLIPQVDVCIFLTQPILSHVQKTFNKLVTEPNMNVF